MPLITQQTTWQDTAAMMQKHRDETYAAVSPAIPDPPEDLPLNVTGLPMQLLAEDVLSITESPPQTLLSDLASGKLTSTAVTKAFLQRAGLAGKLVNCITELLPARAMERAKYLDDFYTEHKRPIGPLHGLPISVKEHVGMKGLDLNAGFVAWVGRIAPDDATILKLLWKAGCIFYVRTTEPQALMHLETSNNIYGVTVNPYNTRLTSGGSSGGEGALLGLKGSCLGIGTDIGGSIRSPAANNGIYGLRPTSFRLPTSGWSATMMGAEHIIPVIGPLSTSLDGVKVFMKAIIDQKPWLHDHSLVQLPWKDSAKTTLLRQSPGDGKRKLRVGVLADDGIVKPHPPILRAIAILTAKLENNPDIEIVDFPPYKHDEAWRIISPLYFADGAAEEKAAIEASGEPFRPLTDFIIEETGAKELTIAELWKATSEREAYKAAYNLHWNSVNTTLPGPLDEATVSGVAPAIEAVEAEGDGMVDVILTPTGPGCAPPLDCARYWGYTAQWNLLDYPALVFPTGLYADPEHDPVEKGYEPRNEKDRYNHELCESSCLFPPCC